MSPEVGDYGTRSLKAPPGRCTVGIFRYLRRPLPTWRNVDTYDYMAPLAVPSKDIIVRVTGVDYFAVMLEANRVMGELYRNEYVGPEKVMTVKGVQY
ncbi:MAG: hypothetical protein HQL56_05730 [Magnetococcales bacterium]|nr:hypothetical protein [Magnetococcales bacterium]